MAADLAYDAPKAFSLYLQAASAGLAEAQLDVAVMYDSGRGTARDAAAAATWYAAAATGGLARAAFDLGQLYADGDGVPQNPALAHAWFAEAGRQGLSAAADRAAAPTAPAPAALAAGDIQPPRPTYPPAGSHLPATATGLALVWTVAPAAAADYYVEVVTLPVSTADPAYATTTRLSAVRMPAPAPGQYAWRVFALSPPTGRYVASPWSTFDIK